MSELSEAIRNLQCNPPRVEETETRIYEMGFRQGIDAAASLAEAAQPRVPADLEGIRERAEKLAVFAKMQRTFLNGTSAVANAMDNARADILALLSRIAELESRGGGVATAAK